MSDTRIDFSAPATLRKWPSVNKERVSAALGARPYMIMDGTLDECIERFMSQPESQHHLYEIHTAPQSDLVSAIFAHNDLFDGGAEDHLLKCRGTVVALPDSSKVIAHRTYSDFLFRR